MSGSGELSHPNAALFASALFVSTSAVVCCFFSENGPDCAADEERHREENCEKDKRHDNDECVDLLLDLA
jgi:hypothetical protein